MPSSYRIARFSFLILASSLSGGVLGQDVTSGSSATGAIELPVAVRDQISKMVPKASPAAPLRIIRGVVESGPSKPRAERHFERLENGFWGVTLVITVRGAIIRRALTLQGLIQLATVTEIDREYDSAALIPVGKYFVSFSVVKGLKTSGSTNTTSVSGDLETLVSPNEGSKFSFDQAWDAQSTTTTTGLFGGTRTSNLSLSLKQNCVVEKQLDASSLHPKLRGKYLPVICEGPLSNGSTRTDHYAFLPDSNLYVLLSTGTDGRADKYIISDVEYAK